MVRRYCCLRANLKAWAPASSIVSAHGASLNRVKSGRVQSSLRCPLLPPTITSGSRGPLREFRSGGAEEEAFYSAAAGFTTILMHATTRNVDLNSSFLLRTSTIRGVRTRSVRLYSKISTSLQPNRKQPLE